MSIDNMKTLGIDYGEKKIGLAISDEMGIIASPMKQLNTSSLSDAVSKVHAIAVKQNVKTIVMGLPLGAKGEETQQSIQTRYFSQMLKQTNGFIITYWDESFSTAKAEKGKKSKKKKSNLDSEAARIILQEYLDSKPNNHSKLISTPKFII